MLETTPVARKRAEQARTAGQKNRRIWATTRQPCEAPRMDNKAAIRFGKGSLRERVNRIVHDDMNIDMEQVLDLTAKARDQLPGQNSGADSPRLGGGTCQPTARHDAMA